MIVEYPLRTVYRRGHHLFAIWSERCVSDRPLMRHLTYPIACGHVPDAGRSIATGRQQPLHVGAKLQLVDRAEVLEEGRLRGPPSRDITHNRRAIAVAEGEPTTIAAEMSGPYQIQVSPKSSQRFGGSQVPTERSGGDSQNDRQTAIRTENHVMR